MVMDRYYRTGIPIRSRGVWTKAIDTANYLRNRLPTKCWLGEIILEEGWAGQVHSTYLDIWKYSQRWYTREKAFARLTVKRST